MRSLPLKLALAFLVVSLTGTLLSLYFIQARTQAEFDRFLMDQEQSDLAGTLVVYYQAHGTWEGVAIIFPSQADGDPRKKLSRLPYLLVDTRGEVVYGNEHLLGRRIASYKRDSLPLQVDGQVIGYLVPAGRLEPWGSESPEGAFLAKINQALLISALLALLIALGLGGLLSRTLTRPLRELTQAAGRVAQGEFGVQVPVRSQDELGGLASAFNHMSSDLEKLNQARRQMTADIAHDLGTPLSVILGYTEALADGKLEADPETYQVMHQEATHLKRLIEDLRLLALADAGEVSLNRQACAPRTLLERTALARRQRAGEAGITLNVAAADDLPTLRIDPERMAQVLGNLVDNALRYTPAGGEITLGAEASAGQVRLTVRDTGAGIAPEDLPYIFNRFYRGSKSRHANGEAGLGLAIAKSLVEAQGGTISVTSAPGQGATFTLAFPA